MYYDMDEKWKDKEIRFMKWLIPIAFIIICLIFLKCG